jgi:hypothetical protein
MQTITTIGLDIAKWVFRVHGVDANGLVVIRRRAVQLSSLEMVLGAISSDRQRGS